MRRLDAGAGVTSAATGDTWRLIRSNGTLWLRSVPGQGACFGFEIPLTKND